jgi:hypothetical protein
VVKRNAADDNNAFVATQVITTTIIIMQQARQDVQEEKWRPCVAVAGKNTRRATTINALPVATRTTRRLLVLSSFTAAYSKFNKSTARHLQ